jgi:hypothetical protein
VLHKKVDFKTNALNNAHVSQLLHFNAGLQSSPECALQVYIFTICMNKKYVFQYRNGFSGFFQFFVTVRSELQEQYGFEQNFYQNKVI